MINVLEEGGREKYGKYKVNTIQLFYDLNDLFNYIEVGILKAIWVGVRQKTREQKKSSRLMYQYIPWWIVGQQAFDVDTN